MAVRCTLYNKGTLISQMNPDVWPVCASIIEFTKVLIIICSESPEQKVSSSGASTAPYSIVSIINITSVFSPSMSVFCTYKWIWCLTLSLGLVHNLIRHLYLEFAIHLARGDHYAAILCYLLLLFLAQNTILNGMMWETKIYITAFYHPYVLPSMQMWFIN